MRKKGTGGKNRRGLEGKGPTPKAEERTYHKAYKSKQAADAKKKSNPLLQRKLKAKKAAAKIKKDALEVIYGRNSVLEAVQAGVLVSRLIFAAGIEHDERTKEILKLAGELNIPLYESPRSELDAISKFGVHQGVLIQIPPFDYSSLNEAIVSNSAGEAKLVLLDHITDPVNLGAIARSAAAFGANIILPSRRSVDVNATVWKVSAGNLMKLKIAKVVNISQTIESLQKSGFFVVALDGNSETNLNSPLIKESKKIAFVAGSEGSGISRLVKEKVDLVAKIPTAVESLNVATAVSIALYEVSNSF